MTIAICVQGKDFSDYLQRNLSETASKFGIECEIRFYLSTEALLADNLSQIDAIFLGIGIDGENGIELALAIRNHNANVVIVLVSPNIKRSFGGFEVDHFRYIIKGNPEMDLSACIREIQKKVENDLYTITFVAEGQKLVLYAKDIIYIEGTRDRRVRVYTVAGSLFVKGGLQDCEGQLIGHGFLRVQRSYLVNMAFIDKIRSYWIMLSNGEQIKASVKKYQGLQKEFAEWKKAHPL